MRSDFETWINSLTDDDGSGTTGTIPNKAFFNTQMGLVDDAINTTGGLITTDTTYYVATTGNDTTGDGSITTPWATPAKALSELGNYRVQDGKTLTIQCDDGAYTFSSPISNLPKGFLLTGKNTYTKTMSSVQSSSGSAGAWSVVINVDNVTFVTLSDYALISAASGGTNPRYIEGIWDITAVDAVNNRITVATTHRGASAPASTVAATVTIIKTVFSFSGVSGVSLLPMAGGGTLSKLVLNGDNTASTHGINLTGGTINLANPFGIRNFGGAGIYAYSGEVFASGVVAISSNGDRGVFGRNNAGVFIDSSIVSGNGLYGIHATRHGHISCDSSIVSGNASYGIFSTLGGNIVAQWSTLNANTTYDACATTYGYICAQTATIAGSTSPAVNTQGNEFGYIDT